MKNLFWWVVGIFIATPGSVVLIVVPLWRLISKKQKGGGQPLTLLGLLMKLNKKSNKPRVKLSGTSIPRTPLYLFQLALIDGCRWLRRMYYQAIGEKPRRY